jgi:hypothetical protein
MHRTHPTALDVPRIKADSLAPVVIYYKVQQSYAARLLEPGWHPEWHRLPPRGADWGRPSLSSLMGPTASMLHLKLGRGAATAEDQHDFLSSSSSSDKDMSSQSE